MKQKFIIYAVVVVFLAWAPYIPWGFLRESIEPWNAVITIIATAISPLIAVQVTRNLDHKRQEDEEKLRIFRTLMENRMARMLSTDYAKALSLVDVVFCQSSSQEKAIRDAFSKHVVALGDTNNLTEQLNSLHDMLYLMAERVGVDVSRQVIARNGIFPAWVENQIAANITSNNANAEFLKSLMNKPKEAPATPSETKSSEKAGDGSGA